MKTEREKMLSGELYVASDPELLAARVRARELIRRYNASSDQDPAERAAILRDLLSSAPADVYIEPPFYCDYGSHIRLGAGVYMNFGCVILDCASVTIGA